MKLAKTGPPSTGYIKQENEMKKIEKENRLARIQGGIESVVD